MEQVDQKLKVAVGTTKNLLHGHRGSKDLPGGCRWSDCPMGRMVSDALMSKCSECDMAFVNGGGIRASIEPGNITEGQLQLVLPFENTFYSVRITGKAIRLSLENSVSRGRGNGRFLQPSGMRYGTCG